MKNYIFFLLVTSVSLVGETYQELREAFKERLYRNQAGLISSREEYAAFIEPIVAQLENACKDRVERMKKNPEAEDTVLFFNTLGMYTTISFAAYVCPETGFDGEKERLKNSLKHELGLSEKADKVAEIIDQGNKEYYQKISIANRIKLKCACAAKKLGL